MLEIRGFITNLKAYNNGELKGMWIDFPITPEEEKEILKAIELEEDEEYFFTDWDGLDLGEYISIKEVNDIAKQDIDEKKLLAYLEAYGGPVEEAIKELDNRVFWDGYTLEEVAYEIVDECYDLPEIARQYFDYKAFASDLRFDGYYETKYGVICCD